MSKAAQVLLGLLLAAVSAAAQSGAHLKVPTSKGDPKTLGYKYPPTPKSSPGSTVSKDTSAIRSTCLKRRSLGSGDRAPAESTASRLVTVPSELETIT